MRNSWTKDWNPAGKTPNPVPHIQSQRAKTVLSPALLPVTSISFLRYFSSPCIAINGRYPMALACEISQCLQCRLHFDTFMQWLPRAFMQCVLCFKLPSFTSTPSLQRKIPYPLFFSILYESKPELYDLCCQGWLPAWDELNSHESYFQ